MSAWARAAARATAERLADVLDLSPASTMTMLAGGSSHLQGLTRDRSTIGFL
jgi:hypothetical protein